LRKGDARALEKLDQKHGFGASVERQNFLEIWKTSSAEIRMRKRERTMDFDDE
jgi:hypothetical protein